MIRGKKRLVEMIALSLGGILFSSLLISQMPIFNRLESMMRDNLLKIRSSRFKDKPDSVSIVNTNSIDFQKLDQARQSYCDLVNFLFTEGKAKVVVINMPYTFAITISAADSCFSQLIKNHHERLVLVSYIEPLSPNSNPTVSTYNHLLPYSKELMQYTIPPEKIVGFFEYKEESSPTLSLNSPSRHICTNAKFLQTTGEEKIEFKSAMILALQKLTSTSSETPKILQINPKEILYQFFSEKNKVWSIGIEQIYSLKGGFQANTEQIGQFFDKIVLVGVTSPNNPIESNLPMRSLGGESISAVEIQAHILTSLSTDYFLIPLDQNLSLIIIIIGSFIGSYFLIIKDSNSQHKICLIRLTVLLVLIPVYLILAYYLSYSGWLLPLALAPIMWLITGILTIVYCYTEDKMQWLKYKLNELEELKKAEQKASVESAKILLQRVATDIHDGPLQDLKLVMDSLEEIRYTKKINNLDHILSRLKNMGYQIRQELHNTSQLAQKMEINPQLRQGLSLGIITTLNELKNTNKLTLDIVQQIETFNEPSFNSKWIAVREDIFRFFREAIANIIKHAQPPFGSASTVIVRLQKENKYVFLEIENDSKLSSEKEEISNIATNKNGYGTKIMTTIARELPEGKWDREILEIGGMKVSLSWNMKYFYS